MKNSGSEEVQVPGLKKKKDGSYSITIECPSGNVSGKFLEAITRIKEEFDVIVHLTSVQKIMLLGLDRQTGKKALSMLDAAGAAVKTKRTLSQAMVCIGKPFCPLGIQETMPLSEYLYNEVADLEIPPKMKLAISGCSACCSWSNMVDVGFIGVKKGYRVMVGGHGGYRPVIGRKAGVVDSYEQAAEIVKKVRDIFAEHIGKKGRVSDVIDKIGFEDFREKLGL